MTDRPLGVLWDMDGVLVDTGEFHYRSWEEVLSELGIPFDRQSFHNTFGRNNHDTLAALLKHTPDPALLAQVSLRKEARFRQLIGGQAELFPGVRSWLERLRSLGVRQAVASSAPFENIEFLVNDLGLRAYFDALCAGHDLPGKPDPAIFLRAAEALHIPPERCLVIEDSLPGIEAAHRAGMRCLAVATTNAVEALSAADIVAERLDQMDAMQILGRL